MANTGYIKFNQKDIVSVIQEETANKLTQSEADNLYLGKTDKAVKAGDRDIPTEEELFAELPTIQLDREELNS